MRITISLQIKKVKSRSDGKCPVYIRCTMDRKRIEYSTGIFIEPENWDDSRQLVNKRCQDAGVLNNRLGKQISKVYDMYNKLEAIEDEFDIYLLKEKLTGRKQRNQLLEIFDSVITSIKEKLNSDYSYSTLKHYRTTRVRVENFINITYHRSGFSLEKVDYQFLNAFDIFLKSKVKVCSNTAWGYHKDLKKILNDAVAMGFLSKNPYETFKVKPLKGNRDFLTIEEVHTLMQKELTIARLSVVRDIFVFSCLTGLSYADMAKLGPQHLHQGDDGEKWIIIDRTKTDTRCQIPLLPKAKSILTKYANNPVCRSKGLLLPVHSNQKMNSYLKELADICGISKNLTMHLARHTFATSVTLNNGVPLETVSKILGHNSVKTTQIYARVLESKISADMKILKTKLKL
jgi:site-specific recombinase XerD